MIKAIVTDIEGTTSSLSFVKDVLFPYARKMLADYVITHSSDIIVKEQIDSVISMAEGELSEDATLVEVIEVLKRWIDEDRKFTPLKTLQGLVWEQGYRSGAYTGHIYSDAFEKLKQWHDQGLLLYVYSSGSVYAQKLLFGSTEYGDITPLFNDYFDTHIGMKGDPNSYRQIASTIKIPAEDILFLSDIIAELDAASQAGLQTYHLVRDGSLSESSSHRLARNFKEIIL